MTFNTRIYKQGDETQIIELLQTVYKKWPGFDLKCSPLDHWEWKIFDNPIKKILVTITETNDRIICSSQGVGKQLKVGESILPSAIAADAAVHPEYRGQGAFSQNHITHLLEAKKKGIRCWSGTTSNPIMINMNKRRGNPFFPHKLVELIQVRDLVKHMQNSRNWRRMVDDIRQSLSNKLQNSVETSLKESSFDNISTITKFDDNADIFWDKIKDNYNFIFVRDKEYLNWRYCDPRGGEYNIKVAHDGDEILGYIVLRVNKANQRYHEGYIVDLMVLPDQKNVLKPLVLSGLNYFDELNVNVVQYWGLDQHPYSEMLKGYGFVEVPFRLTLMFNQHTISKEELDIIKECNIEQMHYCFGDHDMI